MSIVIVEIKAFCDDFDPIRCYLRTRDARFAGRDHQIDAYDLVNDGRLMLQRFA